MPEQYEEMRDKFMQQGMTEAGAKEKAARIYNSQRGKNEEPVTRDYDKKKRKKQKKREKKIKDKMNKAFPKS